ncbi:hypothetical protein ACFWEV_35130 [Streptomyces bacillaris]|uniref:hypothetical protein n=1 Tax=Streptomyces bacillaris TaxID=68179 RepID=UPI003651E14B
MTTDPQQQAQPPCDDAPLADDVTEPEPDPHAELLARLRARNAASEANYRVKSGELP